MFDSVFIFMIRVWEKHDYGIGVGKVKEQADMVVVVVVSSENEQIWSKDCSPKHFNH